MGIRIPQVSECSVLRLLNELQLFKSAKVWMDMSCVLLWLFRFTRGAFPDQGLCTLRRGRVLHLNCPISRVATVATAATAVFASLRRGQVKPDHEARCHNCISVRKICDEDDERRVLHGVWIWIVVTALISSVLACRCSDRICTGFLWVLNCEVAWPVCLCLHFFLHHCNLVCDSDVVVLPWTLFGSLFATEISWITLDCPCRSIFWGWRVCYILLGAVLSDKRFTRPLHLAPHDLLCSTPCTALGTQNRMRSRI